MNPSTLEHYVNRKPFVPFRLHLLSGEALDVTFPGVAWALKQNLMVFHPNKQNSYRSDLRFSEINYRAIERIEQLELPTEEPADP